MNSHKLLKILHKSLTKSNHLILDRYYNEIAIVNIYLMKHKSSI